MSKEKILQIIKRALDDSDFANNLYANPEKALQGFKLSQYEVDLIVVVLEAIVEVLVPCADCTVLGTAPIEARRKTANCIPIFIH